MTRKLILHIGTDKTGSSSIQQALFGYDDGTTAYMNLVNANHTRELRALFLDQEVLDRLRGETARAPKKTQLLAAAARERILAQLALGRETLILSAEGLAAAFGAAEIDRLLGFFAPHVEEIKVIVYLREPIAYRRSGIQERVKRDPVRLSVPRFAHYRRRLEPWEAAVGRDAIDYVLFSPTTPAGRDVVSDFAARVGLAPGVLTSKRVNESMSAEAFALLYSLRARPKYRKLLWPTLRVNGIALQHKQFGKHRFAFAETAFPSWTKEHMAEIAWAEDRLGRPFVPEPFPKDAVVFRSEADVLAYAAANWSEGRRWARKQMSLWATIKAYVQDFRKRR